MYHKSMKRIDQMLPLPLLLVLLLILSVSLACVSEPEAVSQQGVEQESPRQESPGEAAVFNPGSVSQAQYEAAMTDIQGLVTELNRIIRARNYSAWTGYLAESYLAEISAPAFLEERTEELYRRDQVVATNLGRDPRQVQKRILRTARDYFDHVVVPSRSNDRLDDIEFVSEDHVRAFTVDSRGTRLVLYNLVMIGGQWKIIS